MKGHGIYGFLSKAKLLQSFPHRYRYKGQKQPKLQGQQWKPKASSTTLQKEVPKTDKQLQKISMDKPKQKATRQEKGKWVPKTLSIPKHNFDGSGAGIYIILNNRNQ